MSEQHQNTAAEESEISYGDIILKLKSIVRFLIKKWWVLLLAGLIGSSIGWFVQYWYGINYTANCTFTVQGQSASSSLLNSALSLASSIGITAKPGTGSYDNNFFAHLMKSRRILKETLLEQGKIDGKNDLMVNHFIKFNKLDEDWDGDYRLDKFKFKNTSILKLNRLEDSVMTLIFNNINDNYLTVNYDESSPFNQAKFTSPNYHFSTRFLQKLLFNTSNYYHTEMSKLNSNNLAIAGKRVDSIANAIRNLDSKVASLKDKSNNVIKQGGLLELNAAIRDQSLLSIQYSSAVNNYELAKVTIAADSPILEIIDTPDMSTEVVLIPLVLAIITGAITCIFIALVVLILSKFVSNTLENEKAGKV